MMVHKYVVAIMGRGLVGKRLYKYLKSDSSVQTIHVYSKDTSPLLIEGEPVLLYNYDEISKTHYDFLFGCTDEKTTREYFNMADYDYFIDNSNLLRNNPSVPIVVGETNTDFLTLKHKIVSNPNCIVSMLSRVLYPLNLRYPLDKVIVTTYQSVSGLGEKGLEAYLMERDDEIYLSGNIRPRFTFLGQNTRLYDNVVPLVGPVDESGYTLEENKIDFELKKIISPNLETSVMCARVGSKNCHSAYLHLTFKDTIDFKRVRAFIENITSVDTSELGANNLSYDSSHVLVSRIKPDKYCPYALTLYLASDNLTIGSALNSYQVFTCYKELQDALL